MKEEITKSFLGSNQIITKSTLLHLRVPFSFFLLPVFLFALSDCQNIDIPKAILCFIILHFLVFPSSNGYNSSQDKDTTSIGLLKNPPKITSDLYILTVVLDLLAITLGLFLSVTFSILLAVFILMSRAYSYRKIRLKKNPIYSFLIVAFFQGGFIYLTTRVGVCDQSIFKLLSSGSAIRGMAISSLFIGSIYPLTQIYQHRSDRLDGVISLSFILGYTGSFLFSLILFTGAAVLMFFHYYDMNYIKAFVLFSIIMIPVIVFFIYWHVKVKRDKGQANYFNSMLMNFITSLCMNTFFLILLFK